MHKSDLIHTISRLSTPDRRALRKFLQTPYHNTRPEVLQLYRFIDQNLEKNWTDLSKEKAFALLFPDQSFDDQQIRHIMSFLMKNIEQYLILKEATADPLGGKLLLLQAYRKLNLEKPFQRTLRYIERQQTSSNLHDVAFYERSFHVEQETYLHTERQKRDTPRNLAQMVTSLDIAYLAQKLRQSCRQLSHQAVYKVEYDTSLLDQLLPWLTDSEWLEYPAIALYFYYIKAVKAPEEKHWFDQLKQGISAYRKHFGRREQQELLQLAINYTIRRFNTGETIYLRETFELYQLALELELLWEGGRLSRFAFKNIAGIAIRLREFEWTANFVQTYAEKLHPKYRENYVHFCLSKLRYEQGEYKEAMHRLQQVEYDDLFLNLDAKVMLLKIYFELREMDVLDALLTSFKRFIERKQVMGYHRDTYLNIIYFTRKLLELNPYDKTQIVQLRKRIQEAPVLAEREWLLGQL